MLLQTEKAWERGYHSIMAATLPTLAPSEDKTRNRWSNEAEQELANVLGDESIQEEFGKMKKKEVFKQVAQKMKERGHNKSWEQCQSKKYRMDKKKRDNTEVNTIIIAVNLILANLER